MPKLSLALLSLAIWSGSLPSSASRALAAAPPAPAASPAAATPRAPDPQDANLLLWLDSSDRASLTIDPDGRVSAWASKAAKVPRKLTCSQDQRPRYAERALGGLPALQFDGRNAVLRDTTFGQAATAWTVVLVVTPRSNAGQGQFHALLATNRPGQDDFVSGLNLDLGPSETAQFSVLNLEGIKDASGATNLRTESAPFGEGQIIILSTGSGRSRLWINGHEEESRAANSTATAMDELRLGGRFYLKQERGLFHGDVSEVVLFKTELSDADRESLYVQLLKKYGPGIKPPAVLTFPDAWTYLPRYTWGAPRRPLALIDETVQRARTDAQVRQTLETQFIQILQDASATPAAKDFVCRRLALLGSAASVPALAALLSDESCSHMACFALERIPGSAADEALSRALGQVTGPLRIGLIHAVGNRRSPSAAADLARWLSSDDLATSRAAAIAMGKSGGLAAATALTAALDKAPPALRLTVADACLQCAEQFRAAGKAAESSALYERLSAADLPEQTRLAATRGSILIRGCAAVPQLIENLNHVDPQRQALALGLVRGLPGADTTAALAAQLGQLPPDRQSRLIAALADRNDRAAAPAILAALKSSQVAVRLAAAQALGRLGDAAVITGLLAAAAGEDREVAEAAKHSLVTLSAAESDAAILEALRNGPDQTRQVAIEVLGQRAYAPATADLLRLARGADGLLRWAALKALGETAGEAAVPALAEILVAAREPRTTAAAEAAFVAVHQRLDKPEVASEAMAARLPAAEPATKLILLRTLGRLGGRRALQVLQTAAADPQPDVQDTAIRALCDWPTAEPAGGLLQIAQDATQERHRVLALRGYLRLAGQEDVLPPQRLSMAQQALRVAQRDDERKLALGVLANVPAVEALAAVRSFLAAGSLRDEAGAAAVAIAQKLLPNSRAEVGQALDEVLKTVRDQELRRRAAELRERAR